MQIPAASPLLPSASSLTRPCYHTLFAGSRYFTIFVEKMDFNMDKAPKITTPFINLQSDFGFKRAFGSKEFRPVVINFLEAALGDDIEISKVEPHRLEYHDKEIMPADEKGKRIVYDVYFTLRLNPDESSLKRRHILRNSEEKEMLHHFILEMQNIYEPPFEDRMTYYLSKMVAEQGEAGWNYDLDPVILIGVTDFNFPHLTEQLAQEFELREKTTGESLTKKLRMLFYSLKKVPEEWDGCTTELERRLYLIKNMDKMDKDSKPYRDGGYKDLFNAAESTHLAAEDVVLYSQSLSRLRSLQAGLDYRYEEGRAEGRAEGRDEGWKMALEAARAAGLSPEMISRIFGSE